VNADALRLRHGGRVDRRQPLRFRFDVTDYEGLLGDTLASALLANGVHRVGSSVRLGRARGILSAGSAEPTGVVQVEEPFPEPMVPAPTLELFDGLVATSLAGRGRLATEPDPARYDAMHAHCDVLVVGAGPAGLAAARVAARSGARVIVADEQPEPGGSLLGTTDVLDGGPALAWVAEVTAELAAAPDVRLLPRTTVAGYYDDNYLVAVERRTGHLGFDAPARVSRERVWRIRAQQVILATGAHERFLAFANNDRPGILLAASARTYLNRYAVLAGERAVLLTTNDSAYPAAFELAGAGVELAAVVDTRRAPGGAASAGCAERGIPLLTGSAVIDTVGDDRLSAVLVAPLDGDRPVSEHRRLGADLLLVSAGWTPAVHLFSQAGGSLRYDDGLGAFVPDTCRQRVHVAGAARGTLHLNDVLAEGAAAARAALQAAGRTVPPDRPLPSATQPTETPADVRWLVAAPDGDYGAHFVDLQRDVTIADVFRATGAGLRSVEHVKRYTTAGTAHDQGKTSGLLTSAITAYALGVEVGELGVTSYRPPYTPVTFAALAGRDRGVLLDPIRTTAIHGWHVAHGAVFENVGQWKRPWYYPHPGEDMTAAVLRECRAARERVAMMDASTLGKIEVQGPDAAEFLDRLYTNLISTLAVGSVRYGVMCRVDGMVFDDGTVIRLAQDRFLVTTTTGNAAAVLDWMEEWLQTEWPDLRVHCTSVTEQWATVALVGPRSREVLAGLAPGLAVDKERFPFMTWRDATVAGLSARVCRISFSGELAYEINVSSWYGVALWEAVYAAGEALGITPYGTETMHVLRAEKAYPIVGQDTDGTVTPQDLGMGWVVSKKKRDFLGKRSFSRADTSRADRKQLVALLPEDPSLLLPEGAQLVADDELGRPSVPALGHVTSSYRSAVLGRTFALALVRSGRERVGARLRVPLSGILAPVTVAAPVLYDPEGARRDG
jgi:sarcosine oxidase subunit alpha